MSHLQFLVQNPRLLDTCSTCKQVVDQNWDAVLHLWQPFTYRRVADVCDEVASDAGDMR